jgi:mRNA-degrading endonuclease toxin of MazEF toxin-antitoxin module
MPLPRIQRGELWGSRSGLSRQSAAGSGHQYSICRNGPHFARGRATHTTTVVGSRFEISIVHPALQQGAFDVQQITAVPSAKFIRRLGVFSAQQMKMIEERLAMILGLTLAK